MWSYALEQCLEDDDSKNSYLNLNPGDRLYCRLLDRDSRLQQLRDSNFLFFYIAFR